MLRSYTLTLFISLFLLLGLTGCNTPSFGKKVEKKYYTGGQVRSEFEWTDNTGKNGIQRTFGFEGHQESSVRITNGVPNGIMSIYDAKGRVIKQTPYVNGKIHGVEKAFYPNGDRMITFTYQNGLKNGYAYTYYQDGRVCRRAKYKNGRLVN